MSNCDNKKSRPMLLITLGIMSLLCDSISSLKNDGYIALCKNYLYGFSEPFEECRFLEIIFGISSYFTSVIDFQDFHYVKLIRLLHWVATKWCCQLGRCLPLLKGCIQLKHNKEKCFLEIA